MGGCVFKKDEIAFRALCKNKIIKKERNSHSTEKKMARAHKFKAVSGV